MLQDAAREDTEMRIRSACTALRFRSKPDLRASARTLERARVRSFVLTAAIPASPFARSRRFPPSFRLRLGPVNYGQHFDSNRYSLPEARMPDCKTIARGGKPNGGKPKSQMFGESTLVVF